LCSLLAPECSHLMQHSCTISSVDYSAAQTLVLYTTPPATHAVHQALVSMM